jgi:hypothetical protein
METLFKIQEYKNVIITGSSVLQIAILLLSPQCKTIAVFPANGVFAEVISGL